MWSVVPTRRHVLGALAALGTVTTACSRSGSTAVAPTTSAGAARPTHSIVTRWAADPWSLGSYSALPVGATPDDRALLARPFGPIHVAGEATSTDAPATVHGAVASGLRAAAEVAATVPAGGRVVVVGAGAAGLATAATLAPSHSVVVLEARNRPFGRVQTDRSTGTPVELGAAWIHGSTGNPLVGLADEAGVATVPFDWDDSRIVDPDGQVDPTEAEAAFSDVLSELESRADATGISVEEVVRSGTAALDLDQPTARGVDRLVASEIEGESALPARELSVGGWNEGATLVGGDLLVVGGYDRILEPLTVGVEIRTEAPVDRISWDERTPGAVVGTLGGQESADAVVLTVPVAVLQSGRPRLEGPVPDTWTAALRRIGTGTLDKVVLAFGGDRDAPSPPTLVTGWWGPVRGRFATWIDLGRATGAPIVVATSAGDAATEQESLDDRTLVDEATAVLSRITATD